MTFAPQNILVPLALDPEDDYQFAEHAVDVACDMAEKFGASLTLMNLAYMASVPQIGSLDVSQKIYQTLAIVQQGRITRGREKLAKLKERVEARNVKVKSVVVDSPESISHAIVDFAHKEKVDLILIGSHARKGLKKLFLGSVAEHVVHLATVPVLLIRTDKI